MERNNMHRNHCCVSIARMVNTPKFYPKRTLPFALKTVLCLPLTLNPYNQWRWLSTNTVEHRVSIYSPNF